MKKFTWHVDLLSRSPELPVKNYRNSQDSAISSSTGCPASAESGRRHSRRQSDILAKRQEDNSRGVQGYLNPIPIWGVGGDYVHPIVRNHVKLGISLRVPYCVVDAGYGLGRSLGDCRPALPKGRKYQMVHKLIVWTNWWQIWVSFSFEVCWGAVWICHTGLWGFPEAL